MLAQSNGMLTMWDLLKRQHEPVLSVQVCDEPLAKVVAHEAVSTFHPARIQNLLGERGPGFSWHYSM